MIERLIVLKNKLTEKANYYSNLGFPILANEYSEVVNFLSEMKDVLTERDELVARVQYFEEQERSRKEKIRAAQEGESDNEV